MLILRARLHAVGPLEDKVFRFSDEDEKPRSMTCVLGGAGTGKTSLVSALAATRPGHAILPLRLPPSRIPSTSTLTAESSWTASEWMAGDDDPGRPHPLLVTTPGVLLEGELEDRAHERRREQALFERRAGERGFVFVAFPGIRWFGRSPLSISGPDRLLARYDVRQATSFDDATRSDLARETKQILSASAIGASLAKAAERSLAVTRLHQALRASVSELTSLAGYSYVGADDGSFEPLFVTTSGARVLFDDLPTGVRHLASFAAISARALHAAYGGADPRECEGVIAIDDAELHQDAVTQRALGAALTRALPRVQWILTTSSAHLALGCDPSDVIALRRMEMTGSVEVHTGPLALVH